MPSAWPAQKKPETDADNVRLVLYLQFAGSHVISTPHEAEQSVGVGKCARNLHIATVDEFATLREIAEKNPDDLREYYHIEPNGATGHKTYSETSKRRGHWNQSSGASA